MQIDALGEFGLIERIQRALPAPGPDVLFGIGDDVAVLRAGTERAWLATCDVQMEGAHFLRDAITPRDLGRKALAINLSDIAAAGGTPHFALVSLGLPQDLPVEFVDGLYAGLRAEAEDFGVSAGISRARSWGCSSISFCWARRPWRTSCCARGRAWATPCWSPARWATRPRGWPCFWTAA
jgi:hypothetical protein